MLILRCRAESQGKCCGTKGFINERGMKGSGPSIQQGFLVWEHGEGIILKLYIKVQIQFFKIFSWAFYHKNLIPVGLQVSLVP